MLLALLLACQPGTFVPHCDSTSTDLAWDEPSALGFSAADALATLRSTWSADATTLISGSTPLLAVVEEELQARFVDQEEAEAPENAAIAAIAVICDDYLAVGVELSLNTGDDQLDELLAVDLLVPDPEGQEAPELDDAGIPTTATFSTELQTTDLSGEVDISAYTMDGYDSAHIYVGGKVHDDGRTDGTLELLREGEDEDSVYQVSDELAAWGDER